MASGRLVRWMIWKIIEVVLVVISGVSFIITWFHYCRLSKKNSRKPSQDKQLSNEESSVILGKLSIIIAIKNEAKHIGKTIRNFESTTIDKSRVEIILVDSGCKDNSLEVARASAGVVPIKIIRGNLTGGRGSALNQGANIATGDYFLFLRSDCLVPPGYDETIRRELSNSSTLLAAFRFSYDLTSSSSLSTLSSTSSSSANSNSNLISKSNKINLSKNSFQILSFYYNMMSLFCLLPNGSQGYAITKQTFLTYHQYDSTLLLMEDLHFIQLLRNISLQGGGKIKILEQSISISIDDILAIGIIKHTLCNILAYLLLFYTSLSEECVYRWCYIRIPRSLYFITI